MKGVAGSYGFDLISTICHKLEDHLQYYDAHINACEELVDPIFKYKDLLVKVTNAYKNKNVAEIHQIKNELGIFSHRILTENVASEQKKISHIKRKYLIIESSRILLSTVTKILSENKNNELSISRDGYEALGRLMKEKFDVVISSLEVPLINAHLIQEILHKSSNPNSSTNYIIFSSSKDKLQKPEFENVYYLEKKPSIKNDLNQLIDSLFSEFDLPVQKIADGPKKLLLIDDTPDVFKLLKIAFKSHKNIELEYCQDSLQAESVVLKFLPDIILLDLHMPELDGKAVLKQLKLNRATATIPVMFLTADDADKEVFDILKHGAEKVIKKPFNVKELPSIIFNPQLLIPSKAS